MLVRILLLLTLSWASTRAEKPNILLILSDDQSWTDYSYMGHPHIETPRLDQLASESLTYTRGYVPAPLCRPSLASIYTGLYPHQHGITGNDLLDPKGKKVPRNTPQGAALHQKLYDTFYAQKGITSELAKADYLTMQTGKWWESDPKLAGFDTTMTHGDPQRKGRHGDIGLKVSRNGIADIRTFLDKVKEAKKPFFIWHAPYLPHFPHNPPKELFEKYNALVDSPHVARYYAMVEWFDQTCGELLDELEKRGLSKNTVVIYVTDNGWIQSSKHSRFDPLSKQDVHEGGIRTPITIKWPGQITPLMDKSTPVSSIDIAPTILTLAGIDPPKAMTGIDLRDTAALKKRNTVYGADHSHDIANVEQRIKNLESRYIIRGDWKLIIHNQANFPPPLHYGKKNNPNGTPELYNLTKDPHEKVNLADEDPNKVKDLNKALDAWWNGQPSTTP